MTRRTALFALGASVATWQLPALAEQSNMHRTVSVQVYEAPN